MFQLTLKAARINAGLTSKEVAKMVKIHPQTLYKYERDSSNISVSLLEKLCEIYQVPIDYIFLGERKN